VQVIGRRLLPLLLLGLAGLAAPGCPDDPAAADAGPDAAPLVVSGLEVEANPHSVLSCFLRFRTNRAAAPFVELRGPDSVGHRIEGTGTGRSHRVLVFGMLARTTYALTAGARTPGGQEARSTPLSHRTGRLPLHVPRAELLAHDPRRAHGGWTLMTLSAGTQSDAKGAVAMDPEFVPTAVMVDMLGRPVWYWEHGLPWLGDTRYDDGRVLAQSMGQIFERKLSALEVDLSGKEVWRGPAQPLNTVHGHYHHHFEKLPNGNYLTLRHELLRRVIGDVIVELTPAHREAWTWRSFEHLKPDLTTWSAAGTYDHTHGNSVQLDRARGVLYFSARQQNAVYKLQRSTGKVLWRLGAGGDFAKDPSAKHPWFERAHAVEVQPSGNVLLYDNGYRSRGFSRAVEYRLDEQAMKATIAWQYSGQPDQGWQTLYWGDADRLPNGNTLITAGTWASKAHSRVFEVTPGGRKVWEIRLPPVKRSGYTIGIYNSQRLTPPLTVLGHKGAGEDGG
jgi:hypothetical protein